MTSMSFNELLPLIFIGLMGVSLLVYVVSDGYDLGVGMLMHRATPEERERFRQGMRGRCGFGTPASEIKES